MMTKDVFAWSIFVEDLCLIRVDCMYHLYIPRMWRPFRCGVPSSDWLASSVGATLGHYSRCHESVA